MKNMLRIWSILLVSALLLLGLAGEAYAQGPSPADSNPVVVGGNYVLPGGMEIENLVVFGGNARLEAGSTVDGDVVIFGGNLVANGLVRGNVVSFGGDLRLGEAAVVGGNLHSLGGSSVISPKAVIRGERITGVGNLPLRLPSRIHTPLFGAEFGLGLNILWAVLSAFVLAALAVLTALLLPQPTERVARTITTQPLASGGVGLLTLIVAPALLLVLLVTVILIPVAILGMFVFALAVLFGWIALGLEIGNRLAALFKTTWAPAVSAGVGTLIFSLVANLVFAITFSWILSLCCLGIPLLILVLIICLGGAVTSLFGTQVYSPRAASASPAAPIFPPSQPYAAQAPAPQPAAPAAPATPAPDAPQDQSPFPPPAAPPENQE